MATRKQINDFQQKVCKYVLDHPELSYRAVSQNLGIDYQVITKITRKFGLKRRNTYVLTPELLAKLGQ